MDAQWQDQTLLRLVRIQPLRTLPGSRVDLACLWQPSPTLQTTGANIWAASHQMFIHICPLDSDVYVDGCVWNLPVFPDIDTNGRVSPLQHYSITLPATITPETYRLILGLYDPNSIAKYPAVPSQTGQTTTELVFPHQLTVMPVPEP
jgi:hypothetical protein